MPGDEGRRESLCTLGNGYLATRGAMPESTADGVHYPGTYVAGTYNRLADVVDGHRIVNESVVNLPNWLVTALRIDGGAWLDLGPRRGPGALAAAGPAPGHPPAAHPPARPRRPHHADRPAPAGVDGPAPRRRAGDHGDRRGLGRPADGALRAWTARCATRASRATATWRRRTSRRSSRPVPRRGVGAAAWWRRTQSGIRVAEAARTRVLPPHATDAVRGGRPRARLGRARHQRGAVAGPGRDAGEGGGDLHLPGPGHLRAGRRRRSSELAAAGRLRRLRVRHAQAWERALADAGGWSCRRTTGRSA